MGLYFDVGTVRTIITAMDKLKATETMAARKAVEAAGRTLRDIARDNISLTDHSLGELARMRPPKGGHPYAKRHGTIQIHRGGSTKFILDSRSQVHTKPAGGPKPHQTGRGVKSLRGSMYSAKGGYGYRVRFDLRIAPHMKWVVGGTKKMIARNVLRETAAAKGTQTEIMRTVTRTFGLHLRSKAQLRFETK